MSRRSRRSGGRGSWLGKILLGFVILLFVGLGFGYVGLRSYLHSDGFRKFLSAEAGGALEVVGEFEEFRWDGLAARTGGFEAVGEGMISSIKMERIETEIGYGGFSRGVWEVGQTRIGNLEVEFAEETESEPVFSEPQVREKVVEKAQSGWLPKEVELESLEIARISVAGPFAGGMAVAEDMSLMILPKGGQQSYAFEVDGGSLSLPIDLIPELKIERVHGVYQPETLFLNEAKFSGWESGLLRASGEFDFVEKRAALEGKITGLRCDDFLNESWARKLSGDAASSFVFDNRSGLPMISGELVIENGALTALPMLDALAAYADTRRFRNIVLSESRTKWKFSEGEILFTDIVLASEGLVRLEGTFSVNGDKIDGRLRLGLVPGILRNIPGAEEDVFQPGEHGLLWTPVHITGALDDMDEDLTRRLIEAAGMRMFERLPESGELAIKFAGQALGEHSDKFIQMGLEEGLRALEDSDKVKKVTDRALKEAGGLLESLLGK